MDVQRGRLSCAICREILKDPATVPCGHSFCMACIQSHFDTEDQHGGVHSCPRCRRTFTPRPVLEKNDILAFVLEQLQTPEPEPPPAELRYAGAADVACDVCSGRKLKAVKSCLVCMVSYCETHLQPHYDVPPLRKHNLEEPCKNLQDKICARHQEVMKLFCRTDQRCICYLCSKDEHKGHDKVSAAAERAERQRELQLTRKQILQRLQDRETYVKLLQQEEDAVNRSAEDALANTDKVFGELIRMIDKRVSDVKERVKSRQRTESGRIGKVREKVEQEMADLQRKDAELEKLSHTEDHTHFLLNYPSLCRLGESRVPPSVRVRRPQHFNKVLTAVSDARDKLQEVLREEYAKISLTVTDANGCPATPAEPTSRADFLVHACPVTLDANTANSHLSLSKANRKAAFVRDEQEYPPHPDRFAYSWQVLSVEGLAGRSYWEVERSGRGVLVAVAYGSISRAGKFSECVFGHNDKSWALDCYQNSCEFRHNNARTPIPGTWSSRVGVYLDHDAGVLSFYSVAETMTLLHRVQTRFSEPLHAGLWLSDGAAAELLKLK